MAIENLPDIDTTAANTYLQNEAEILFDEYVKLYTAETLEKYVTFGGVDSSTDIIHIYNQISSGNYQ